MLLRFSYEMRDNFSSPVKDHHFSFMCVPRDTNRQRVIDTQYEITPCSYSNMDTDFLGNIYLYGEAPAPHSYFGVRISGIVETGLAPEEHRDSENNSLFLLQTKLTKPGSCLKKFFGQLQSAAPDSEYGRALYYLQAVYNAMNYESGRTTVGTTAEAAFSSGAGVCQDYAHILLALLRMAGLPARYCVGMMTGEGASHAWAEVYCRGYWYGMDPVHNLLVDERYIKISHGRDYSDCIVNRGIFRGICREDKELNVSVYPIE